MTPRDIIKKAMLDIGAIGIGETPTAAEYQDGLLTLNLLLDSWSANGLTIPTVVREEFDFIPGQQTYTMGPAGNFVSSRPSKILYANAIENGIELPIDIITPEQWSEISLKSTEGTFPQCLYPENTYPLETLNFWPKPNTANKVVLYSEKAFSKITNAEYRDWETDRKSTRLNSSHSAKSRMPSSA